MRARREEYFQFARRSIPRIFNPDGTFRVAAEAEFRTPYWLYPAYVTSPAAPERELAQRMYAAAANWDKFDVFTTSSIAVNLVRERNHMRADLVRRSEEHLHKFVVSDGGRAPCSGAYDYTFHGYNDNMPALATRAMILAGDALGRRDYTDQGLFHLEGLGAHFERRGLLSEYTSATYTAITLTALLDVADCTANREARELALACANRILLDIFGHWHPRVGGLAGAQSRAYTVDCTESLSVMNALMWYLTGSPLCVNPIEALSEIDTFAGHVHCARNFPFNLAQFAEVMPGGLEQISAGVQEFGCAPRPYPYELHATTDSGQVGLFGGGKEIQTRAFHQPLYGLGTASATWFSQSGDSLLLHAVVAASASPQSWRDRIPIWHRTIAGTVDYGDAAEFGGQRAEVWQVVDAGHYHTLQKRGSALVLGALGPALAGQDVSQLKFSVVFGTVLRLPDEIVEAGPWQFCRFGDVYIGIRMSAMVDGQRLPVQRLVKNKYLRVEVPLLAGRTVPVTHEFREWCDFGYAFEIAAKPECGSFAEFRRQCGACTWEFYHSFYRNSRYCGRHGELQIIDSVAAGSVRFMAIDGVVEPKIKLAATGLDPKLTQLFPDGRRIKQRRLAYRPQVVGSPFYQLREHILETDLPGPP